MRNTAFKDFADREIWRALPLTQEEFCIADEGKRWVSREVGLTGTTLFFGSVTMFMSQSGDCVVFRDSEVDHAPLVRHAAHLALIA